jgi:hypothetical protein
MQKLISLLDSITPFVQAFDCVLMILCGVICLRSRRQRKRRGLTTLAVACFISAVILLGFFLSAEQNGHALFPLHASVRSTAYLVARLLAPFELLLFVIGIVMVVRATADETPK